MGNLILFLKNAVGIKNCIIALCILLILGMYVFTNHSDVIKKNTHEDSLVASTFEDSNNAKDTADDPESNKDYLEFNNREVVGGQDYDSYSREDDDVIIDIEHNDNLKYLQPNLIPAIVHFVWCGDRCFEFRHYLAMKSAIRLIRPDKIMFHYETLPVMDKRYYNQWFELLKQDYEFLYVQQMNNATVRMCSADHKSYTEHVINLLNDEGGMYMGISTILTNFSVEHRKVDVAYGLEEAGTEGFLLMRAGIWDNIRVTSQNSLEYDEHLRTETGTCCTLLQYQENPVRCQDCLVPRGDAYKTIKPFDIWERDDALGRLVRKIFYNTEEMLVPQPSYDSLVPNIGHMIWIGGRDMDFVFYLSALSMLYVMEVDRLYIHGDEEPGGNYWQTLRANHNVTFVNKPQPYQIYQGPIEPKYKALMSDLLRVDIMIRYGGIYSDTDAVWVKKLTNEQRAYGAVASFDWVDWSYPFPDTVNFGLSYGKKDAPFWRIFRDSMRTLHNDLHGFSGVMMPYKLLELYPHLLKIDRHLAVICYHSRCHPTWVKDYHNQENDHVVTNSIPNWREDVHAFHWTHPNPDEFLDQETLMNSNGVFAELGQNVLKKAGII